VFGYDYVTSQTQQYSRETARKDISLKATAEDWKIAKYHELTAAK